MNRLTDPAEIRRLLDTYGFHFSKSMGQNFLIDASVPERIAESAEADRDCAVLEIGPGIGCLTSELSERAGKVLSVELDRSLKPLLREAGEARLCKPSLQHHDAASDRTDPDGTVRADLCDDPERGR